MFDEDDLQKRMILHQDELILSPQAAATTFNFASVFILLLCLIHYSVVPSFCSIKESRTKEKTAIVILQRVSLARLPDATVLYTVYPLVLSIYQNTNTGSNSAVSINCVC